MEANEHRPPERQDGLEEPGTDAPARVTETDPPTGEVRIAAVPARVAAGLEYEPAPIPGAAATEAREPDRLGAASDDAPGAAANPSPDPSPDPSPWQDEEGAAGDSGGPESYAPFSPDALVSPSGPEGSEEADVLAAFGIPDWTEPPTGQVPRVLLEQAGADPDAEVAPPGPTWREEPSDWDDLPEDFAFLAEDDSEAPVIAGREPQADGDDPYGLGEIDVTLSGAHRVVDDSAWQELFGAGDDGPDDADRARTRPERARRARTARAARTARTAGAAEAGAGAPARSAGAATATGIVFGAIAIGCILGGPASSLGLAVAVLFVATGEVFLALRRGGYRPASIVGLVAVPALAIGGYGHGTSSVVLVLVLSVVACALWAFAGLGGREPVTNLAVSVLVIIWVGLLGAYAGLLLSPAAYPNRHGVDLFFGAIICTVAHDVGSYLIGSRLGRHRLAPRLSPGKTLEGLAGGTVCAFAVALGICWRISPYSLGTALGLAVVVSVFAPAGDLFESLIKRDLSLKDMGSLLPGHGGVFDRVDALVFVLPAVYYLTRVVHFG